MARILAVTIALLALATAESASASTPGRSPLGVPIPVGLSPADAASNTSESGNAGGVLPGARLCGSAERQDIALPADDAPHEDALEEWWFWNGHLRTQDGRRLAFIAYFFSRGAGGPYTVDYSVLDIDRNQFHHGREPLLAGRPGGSPSGFALRGAGASATGSAGRDRLRIRLDGYALDLSFKAAKPAVPLFTDGHENAYCNRAYFYARPRMTISGRATTPDGGRTRVRGEGWFDHAWGFFPALAALRWQYIQIQLADGRDVFVGHLELPGALAELDVGVLVDARGHATPLHRGDFLLTPTDWWRRDGTCSYPVEFDVQVGDLDLTVRAPVRHAEFRADALGLALWPEISTYWDGPAVVGGDARGRGWIDLGRYCAA